MPEENGMLDDMKFNAMIEKYGPETQYLYREIRTIRKTCERRKYCPSPRFSKRQAVYGITGLTGWTTVVALIVDLISKSLN